LLASSGLLLRAPCDPNLAKAEAMALGGAATRVDPKTDVALVRGLADSAGPDGGPVPMEAAPGWMEILAEISDGSRILPWMMRLMRHSNPSIRSKAVLMIGRGGQSVQWLKGCMAQANPRIRANAIEAMGSVNSREAQVVLRFALADANNRVVGYALLGLLHWGLLCYSGNRENGPSRSRPFPLLGHVGDGRNRRSRFTKTLVRMLVEPNAVVRKRAFTGIGRIKAAAIKPAMVPSGVWRA
jgi:hypothetical protein